MAKKTRTELSTLAINTNLPDNTQELITPTTERSQLTDERESVINYKDDLGGAPNAGKFLTVATDGESLTMVDEPSGVPDWVTFITAVRNQMLLKAGGDGTGTTEAWLKFTSYDGATTAQINFNGIDGSLYINGSQSQIQLTSAISFIIGGTPRLTISSTGGATFNSSEDNTVTINTTNVENNYITLQKSGTDFGYLGTGSGILGVAQGFVTGDFILRSASAIKLCNGNNAALTISSGGNVGIGVSPVGISSFTTLHIEGATGGGIKIGKTGQSQMNIQHDGSDGYINNTASGNLFFYTADSPRLTLSSGGNATFASSVSVGGGGSGGTGHLAVRKDAGIPVSIANESVTGTLVIFSGNGSGIIGSITHNGSSTSFNTSSDYRLKENVTPITDALSRLNQLKPSRFNFIADADRTVDGFIAHEVEDVIPEAICGEKDAIKDEEFELTPRVDEVIDEEGNVITEAVDAVMDTRSVPDYQGIDQSKIVPLLTAAIQEQQTIIESLITRLEALEA